MKEKTRTVQTLVQRYIEIEDKNIRSYVLKVVSRNLVNATEKFTKTSLYVTILKGADSEEARRRLVEKSQKDRDRIKELLQLREATREALEVLAGQD